MGFRCNAEKAQVLEGKQVLNNGEIGPPILVAEIGRLYRELIGKIRLIPLLSQLLIGFEQCWLQMRVSDKILLLNYL